MRTSQLQTWHRRQLLFGGLATLAARKLFAQTDRAALVEDLVAANRILFAQGIVDAFGHVSVRSAPNVARYLISRSLAPAQVVNTDIIEYDLDSNPAAGESRTGYRERFIHGEVYRARPDVMSVVHCHAPSLIPFGITRTPLRPVYHNSSFVGEGIPVFEIRDGAGDTDMLVGSPELGRALAKVLANKPAALMRGHGAVIVGKSIVEAVARSVYLEVNARVQAQAMAMGTRIEYLSDGEVKKRAASGDEYTRAWELWKTQVAQSITQPAGARPQR
jgi:HCOMODA/2-hydroxy-3-carboxy-muconic semialdehyde decarboxylase